MELAELLRLATETGASDVHLMVNTVPVFRMNGVLIPVSEPPLDGRIPARWQRRLLPEDTGKLAGQVMNAGQQEKFQSSGEADLSFSIPGVGRFRINVYRQRGSTGLAVRPVKMDIPPLARLGLPEVVSRLTRLPRGLVLVTGPTGSGKSTTLAAMIELLNSEARLHIITIEDPIEFAHRHRHCLINQREIGQDTVSFASALRAAMREDPDVIMIGEMRDLETIAGAITAAETGHLVLATLHTSSAAQTIDRIIDVFPPHQQEQIRVQLANTIQGVVSQQLLPRQDGAGRVIAVEVMVATPAVRNLIRESKTFQIPSQIQSGARFGMQSMEMSLRNLYRAGLISREEALGRAGDPEGLLRML
ncbi:type IV pilus twitching motility protein PilT [Desulfotomaculum copahuensis]|uniref:Type IV pili twitching motility protein PilT n=1 Tax=Desulfotomaculum copahuensis TaxID=1838280 RepID=A0A1B7LBI0_9FIRM|nr:type IV pilus twitching motility protein PilT [Desulfotomaculum copahuensis]OAT79871.1 type IV pili twitching motility protein PilT [Desulfotomaculum copahuensis]